MRSEQASTGEETKEPLKRLFQPDPVLSYNAVVTAIAQ